MPIIIVYKHVNYKCTVFTEKYIIPTTWRENGAGLLGDLGDFSYKAYIVNGLKGEDFDESGLRGGRQKGSKALAEDWAGVLRLDYQPASSFMVGGSVYGGNSGQDLDISIGTLIYEGHLDYRKQGWRFRALAAMANLDDTGAPDSILNAGSRSQMFGLPENYVG